MGITSFYFICFIAAALIIYYLIPKKLRWGFLLLCSIAYYLLSDNGLLIIYPLVSAATCYFGARLIYVQSGKSDAKKKLWLGLTLLVNLGILVCLKYVNFVINTVNGISGLFGKSSGVLPTVNFLIPLGVSFYTFSLLGYVLDVYYGLDKPDNNFLHIALYGLYFPAIISGPIMKFRECGKKFFAPHEFDYIKVTRGLQRFFWGFFKKLVIAERLRILVDTVYGSYYDYPGAYIWFATACYALQLYTDFSGCMDIVLGISESFGIDLPENFRTPFFSKSVAEYWRRWHITLGVWMKEYVFFPLLRSSAFTGLAKKNKDRFGKKRGKQLTTFAAMFVLWLTVGIWHGGDWKYVLGSGLIHWMYIVLEELLEEPFGKMMTTLHINSKAKWVDGIRILRTFILVCIGDLFFRSESTTDAFRMLGISVSKWNPIIIIDGSLLNLGIDIKDMVILVVSLTMLLVVSLMQEKVTDVRGYVATKPLILRWAIWFALIFFVILVGYYGPGFDAADFIYQGF